MDGPERVSLIHGIGPEDPAAALFLARAVERGVSRVRIEEWPATRTTGVDVGEALLRVDAEGRQHLLLERETTLVHLTLFRAHVAASVADRDESRVARTVDWLRELFPSPEPTVRHEVPVTFWTYSPNGPMPSWRSIAVPGWEDIHENYGDPTRAGLERLMSGFTPERGGQLILWHGSAGTGKTYALRALAWEWKDWCEFHYIVDPDTFFGQHADYLMNVLLQPTHVRLAAGQFMGIGSEDFGDVPIPAATIHHFEYGGDGQEDGEEERGWKLLMLEDTGELLTADARAVIGQGLSRFLNVVDGLIGQGLRVLVLVTTNEEIRKLHPAVARPGRCAANVEFTPLSVAEARAWLERNGVAETVSAPTTLASLYARKSGLEPGSDIVGPGFGG